MDVSYDQVHRLEKQMQYYKEMFVMKVSETRSARTQPSHQGRKLALHVRFKYNINFSTICFVHHSDLVAKWEATF